MTETMSISTFYFPTGLLMIAKSTMRSLPIKPKRNIKTSDRELLEDADCDGRSLSMLQKIAGALNQKVEINFLAIAP